MHVDGQVSHSHGGHGRDGGLSSNRLAGALRFVIANTRLVKKLNAAGSGFDDSAAPLGDALSVLT